MSGSYQISLPAAGGLLVGNTILTTAIANETVRTGIWSFGSSVFGGVKDAAVYCVNGVKNTSLGVIGYASPSTKALIEREVAVETLVRPFSSIVSESTAKSAGSISVGTLGHAAFAPGLMLMKTGFTTACRYVESYLQHQKTRSVLHDSSVNALPALTKREADLTTDAKYYKKLSERSILPGKAGLLFMAVPTVLLLPELGFAALTVGAVAGVAQVASNAWEKWANSGMRNNTMEQLNLVNTKCRLLELENWRDQQAT